MHFSEREKNIIKKIASGEIHDLPSYMAEMVVLKEEVNVWGGFQPGGFCENIIVGETVKIIEDESSLARELTLFLALCYKLQGLQFLQVIQNSIQKTMPRMLAKNIHSTVGYPYNISSIFTTNLNLEIAPFSELSKLIQDDFTTAEERHLLDERNARVTAQRTTVVVAVLGLLISTVTSVGITYFNYKTYSSERKVSISNLDVIKYPIPVSIAEPPKQDKAATSSFNNASDKNSKAAQRLP